jgi:hypothetical protein
MYIFLPLLVLMSMVTNSCKKESQTQLVESLLTRGPWQLASVIRHNYVGDTEEKPDTLNTACTSSQLFTFTADHNCTYTNFSCITQSKQGGWSLTSDDLFLNSSMSCTDTATVKGVLDTITRMPFVNAKIQNLGNYSLIIQTGDISAYYTSTTKRIIIQYGFVHPATH